MTERERMGYAKLYLEKMADGINPLNGKRHFKIIGVSVDRSAEFVYPAAFYAETCRQLMTAEMGKSFF